MHLAFSDENNDESPVKWRILSQTPFLAAISNETLRLHPPVQSGSGRTIPQEGMTISSGRHSGPNQGETILIPGNALVFVPMYTLHRSPRYWIKPHAFFPEPWTRHSDLILDRGAFCPFSLGAYGCAGKYITLMEIKFVISQPVMDFDVKPMHDWIKTRSTSS